MKRSCLTVAIAFSMSLGLVSMASAMQAPGLPGPGMNAMPGGPNTCADAAAEHASCSVGSASRTPNRVRAAAVIFWLRMRPDLPAADDRAHDLRAAAVV